MRTLLTCVFLLILTWVPSNFAHATVIAKLSEQQMVHRASLIVRGTVISQKVLRVGPTRRVVTDYVIRVQHYLKGRTIVPLVTVRCMGGSWKGLTVIASGEARLRVKEEVLLYLDLPHATPWNPSPGHYVVFNMGFGKYGVFRDPQTKTLMVYRQADLPAVSHRVSAFSGKSHIHHAHFQQAPTSLKVLQNRIFQHLKVLKKIALQKQLLKAKKSSRQKVVKARVSSGGQK